MKACFHLSGTSEAEQDLLAKCPLTARGVAADVVYIEFKCHCKLVRVSSAYHTHRKARYVWLSCVEAASEKDLGCTQRGPPTCDVKLPTARSETSRVSQALGDCEAMMPV